MTAPAQIAPAVLDASGRPVSSAEINRIKVSAMLDGQYRSGGRASNDMSDWNPYLGSADSDWLQNRDTSVARVRDLARNEGWAQSAINRKLDQLVGGGWRFSSRVDWRALNIDANAATGLRGEIQSAFKAWANDPLFRCDAEQDQNWPGLLNLAVREYVTTGECLAALRWTKALQPSWPWRTSLQIIDVDRLSNPNGMTDSDTLRGGVEKNEKGAAIAYHIRNAHPGEYFINTSADRMTWTREARFTPHGRPRIIHLKTKRRPQESRAVSDFVAGLSQSKMLSRFKEAELQNATVNALFAAVITSNMDPAILRDMNGLEDVKGVHEMRNGFYDQTKPSLSGVKIGHLYPGDTMDFNTAGRPTAAFPDFQVVFLQSLAASLDLTYEELSMDFSRVNYSSARAAMVVVSRAMTTAKSIITCAFANLVLLAVTEDAIDLGKITLPDDAPGLYEAPAAWLAGKWIGPAKGWVDPVKEVQAAVARLESGLSTFEDEAAAQGLDFEETIDQLAREHEMFSARGLTPPSMAAMTNLRPATDNELPPPPAS